MDATLAFMFRFCAYLEKEISLFLELLFYSGERNSEGSCTQDDLGEDRYKQVTSLLILVRSSSSKSPEAYALFMDELSSIIAQGKLVSKVEVNTVLK